MARVRLMRHCGPDRAFIPLAAMRPQDDREALGWSRDFEQAVRRDAEHRRLMQAPVRTRVQVPLLLAALVPSLLIALTVAHYWKKQTFIPVLAFLLAELLAASAFLAAVRVRVTAAGHAELAAARRAGHTATAQAHPSASNPDTRVLPQQLGPLPKNQIWSDYGGFWHPLDLESREVYGTASSRSPLIAVTCMAIFCAGSVAYNAAHSHHLPPLSGVVFLGLPAIVLAAILLRTARRRTLPKQLVLEGKVARLWSVNHDVPRGNTTAPRHRTDYYCTLDVGRAPASVRLTVGSRIYQSLEVGDLIEVAVRPRRGTISGLRNLGEGF